MVSFAEYSRKLRASSGCTMSRAFAAFLTSHILGSPLADPLRVAGSGGLGGQGSNVTFAGPTLLETLPALRGGGTALLAAAPGPRVGRDPMLPRRSCGGLGQDEGQSDPGMRNHILILRKPVSSRRSHLLGEKGRDWQAQPQRQVPSGPSAHGQVQAVPSWRGSGDPMATSAHPRRPPVETASRSRGCSGGQIPSTPLLLISYPPCLSAGRRGFPHTPSLSRAGSDAPTPRGQQLEPRHHGRAGRRLCSLRPVGAAEIRRAAL